MNDILPAHISCWQWVERRLEQILLAYGYEEIRIPLLESTDLFKRSIGEVTDIVEKEMYTFADRNGDSLTLRPEGTAGCVRAAIEGGMLRSQVQRLWYMGAMFRHERPQKGRYRQFHQLGVETFGAPGPDIDSELILMSARMLRRLGLEDVTLEINSLGTAESRARYRDALVGYFGGRAALLDEDSRRRLSTNPLRILDSKSPDMQVLIGEAPRLTDYLDGASREHFAGVLRLLDDAAVAYRVNPRLVRGLDYYTRTVFEWVTSRLGAQGTVCAGGRFDGLVEQLGGPPTPAAGFAMGLERIVSLLGESAPCVASNAPDAYLVWAGEVAHGQAVVLAERVREALPQLRLKVHCGGGGLKSQFKHADRSGARFALILGEAEAQQATVGIKALRGDMPQQTVAQTELVAWLGRALQDSPRADPQR